MQNATERRRTRREEAVEAAMADGLGVKDWFVMPGANQPARRHEVWTLLDWYHRTVVQPNQGLAGVLRRLWWRVTGQWEQLETPWETIHRKVAMARARREALVRQGEYVGHPEADAPADKKIEVVRG